MAKIESNDFEEYEVQESETPEVSENTAENDKNARDAKNPFGSDDDTDVYVAAKSKSFKGIIITVIVLAVLVLGVGLYFIVKSLSDEVVETNTVYPGISINGFSLENMTKQEVADYIRKEYVEPIQNSSITIEINGETQEYTLSEFVQCPDPDAIAEEAYSIARTGPEADRIAKIADLKTNPVSLSVSYSISDSKVENIIQAAYDKLFHDVVDPTYTIRGDRVTFTAGTKGINVDTEKLDLDLENILDILEQELAVLKSGEKLQLDTIKVETSEVDFKPLDAQEIMESLYVAPKNATYRRESLTEIGIVSDVPGVSVDEEELSAMVKSINEGEQFLYKELLFIDVPAKITSAYLASLLFRDVLGEDITSNNPEEGIQDGISYTERSINIKQASSKLNGYCLMPGESCNFFTVVGTVSEYTGFVKAYDNARGAEKIIGGGISQVASACYVASLKAGLNILEHKNNKYIVNFGQPGFDVYVEQNKSYFTFSNNTDYPIKLSLEYSDLTNLLTVKIFGTTEKVGTFSLTSELDKIINYNTIRVDDDTLPVGTQIVEEGITGYVFKLYKETPSVKLAIGTATYEKKDKIIRVGTKAEQDGDPV